MKIKGLHFCSFDPYDEFGLPKGTRYRQHNNPFISFSLNFPFTPNYGSSSGWTQTGTTVSISGGFATFATTPENSTDGVSIPIGASVDDNTWSADFNVKITTITTNPAEVIFGLSAGASNIPTSSQDALGCMLGAASATHELKPFYKDGAGALTYFTGPYIQITAGTQYYCRLVRTSSTQIVLHVFTDSGRTTEAANSPSTFTIPSTVIGLNTLQHSGWGTVLGGGSISGLVNGTVINSP